jgi:hypothetical protein
VSASRECPVHGHVAVADHDHVNVDGRVCEDTALFFDPPAQEPAD